ncbi:MAG TPA: glutathione S-transferase N-terminal domain-containing protein [Candidatus Paceibacterota bacterium]|nr:glutathione S-transferase N-terminal domain-containing protein [Candidatus Paceibacterota bacterium]
MLTLYMRPLCPYCIKVLKTAHELGIVFELKNIANPEYAAELRTRGGKQQVPYLVDADRSIEMYESEDIVAYLTNQYSKARV